MFCEGVENMEYEKDCGLCVCVEDMMSFWFLKMLDFVSKRRMKGVEVCEEVAEGG